MRESITPAERLSLTLRYLAFFCICWHFCFFSSPVRSTRRAIAVTPIVRIRVRICVCIPVTLRPSFILKFISQQPLIRKHSYLDYRYPGGPAFIPWFLTPGLMPRVELEVKTLDTFKKCFSFQLRQIVCQTSISLVTLTYGSWSEGHHDLYFTAQWFCLIFWRLFDIWTPYFRIMS